MTVEEYNKIPLNEEILIKSSYGNRSVYYVVVKENEGADYYGNYNFTEAAGEGYYTWDIKHIVDWIPCKELDKLFAQRKKKGHWTNGESICPCCGEDKFKDLDADIWADWQPKYCPNCGAKMENEE